MTHSLGYVPYACAKCGVHSSDGIARRAPGKQVMGRALIEQFVCSACQGLYVAAIEKLFAGGSSADPTKCSRCRNGFGQQGPFYAHRHPVLTEEWKIVTVCHGCFEVYCAECNQVANGE